MACHKLRSGFRVKVDAIDTPECLPAGLAAVHGEKRLDSSEKTEKAIVFYGCDI
jgi:hypothetical protein